MMQNNEVGSKIPIGIIIQSYRIIMFIRCYAICVELKVNLQDSFEIVMEFDFQFF